MHGGGSIGSSSSRSSSSSSSSSVISLKNVESALHAHLSDDESVSLLWSIYADNLERTEQDLIRKLVLKDGMTKLELFDDADFDESEEPCLYAPG